MQQNLEALLELAKTKGCSHSEVYQVSSLARPVFFEGNRLKQLENSQSEGTALRLWYQDRPGVAVAYGKIDPPALVEKALAVSRLNLPEAINLAPARTQIIPNQDQSIPTETFIDLGRSTIAKIRQSYPEAICSAEFDCETERTTLINSQGLHCDYTETSLSSYLGVELVRGDDFLGIYEGEIRKNNLSCDEILENVFQHLRWAKTNTSSPQGKMPVILTANAATLLWHTVASALNGKRIIEKSSPWSDRLNQTVASSHISLTQQPNLSPYICPFDDEGIATQELSLIANGELQSFYYDLDTAKELKTDSTGNGFREDLGSYPAPSLVNLIVQPGELSFQQLIKKLDNGIIVHQLLGGGADISGDFSLNVELGYRVKNGEVIGRIKDTAISGNVYQILKKAVTLGNDFVWNGSCRTPSMIVEDFSVVS